MRTGKRLWIFHTIPMPGEFGNETWLNDSWAYTGNAGVWANIAVDEELGLAYLPVELPTGDWYGGNRPGNGLFGESLVAVDLKTGQRRWHYQLIHHGLWDYDIPAPPILLDITVDGKPIKAIAQPTKQAFLYVFDRATGQPVWPIEERPVPKGDVPGEWYAPTQPFPTKPPAFDRQGFSIDDLIDFTPELRAEAVKLVSRYKIGPLYTPPVVSKWEGPLAMLMLPSAGGGTNWAGRFGRSGDRHVVRGFSHHAHCGRIGSRRSGAERFRIRVRPGACASRAGCRRRRRRPGGPRRRRRGRRPQYSRTATGQTTMGTHHRVRHEQGGHRVADRARRDA